MLFSIIVGVFPPYGDLIYECLDSIKRQEFDSYEVLLICFKDDRFDLSQYIKDQRFKTIYVDINDLDVKRNAGLINAKGDYLFFVDCDDLLADGTLNLSSDIISENDPDVIQFKTTRNISLIANQTTTKKSKIYRGNSLFEYAFSRYKKEPMIIDKDVILDGIWSKCIRRKVVTNFSIRFPDRLIRADDALFGNKVFINARKIVSVDFYAYYWRKNAGSETANINSPFYLLEPFCLKLLEILNKVDCKYYDNIDNYLNNLIHSQINGIKEHLYLQNISISNFIYLLQKTFPYKNCNTHRYFTPSGGDSKLSYFLLKKRCFLVYAFLYKIKFLFL